ncbi:MAG: glycosyltransferase family 4 protein [Lachnospirales bacterium]
MKLLMIEHFLPGNTYTLELLKKLKDYVDITLLCKKNAANTDSVVRAKKILYTKINNKIFALFSYGISLIRTAFEIIVGRYDVIHIQTFKMAKVEIPLYKILKKITKAKWVYTVHNILPHETKASDKKIYSGIYNMCHCLIVHNEQSKIRLIKDFNINEDKIRVIAHGAYEAPLAENVKNGEGKINYLAFGAMRKYKGIDILLNAISLIPKEERKNKTFVIAGRHDKGQDNNDYEKMIKDLDIEDCVTLIERRIEDSELPQLFGKANVCVFPYREIYGSGALLMAYTYSKPVIASDVPVFVEETDNGKTGMLFESENPKSLADTIIKFANVSNKVYNDYENEIKRLVNEKYNWSISAKKTYDVYRE